MVVGHSKPNPQFYGHDKAIVVLIPRRIPIKVNTYPKRYVNLIFLKNNSNAFNKHEIEIY